MLRETSRRALAALGDARITRTEAVTAAEGVTTEMTGVLDDARLDGVDIDADLPGLVREIAGGAVSSVGTTGISDLDDDTDVPNLVAAITRSTTGAVRTLRLDTNDPTALEGVLSRVVREVSAATTYALRDAAAGAEGVTISLTVNVQAVVDGASYGVADLSDQFGSAVSIGTVVDEVARGASEGSRRLAGDDDALYAQLEASIAERIAGLEVQIAELTEFETWGCPCRERSSLRSGTPLGLSRSVSNPGGGSACSSSDAGGFA